MPVSRPDPGSMTTAICTLTTVDMHLLLWQQFRVQAVLHQPCPLNVLHRWPWWGYAQIPWVILDCLLQDCPWTETDQEYYHSWSSWLVIVILYDNDALLWIMRHQSSSKRETELLMLMFWQRVDSWAKVQWWFVLRLFEFRPSIIKVYHWMSVVWCVNRLALTVVRLVLCNISDILRVSDLTIQSTTVEQSVEDL